MIRRTTWLAFAVALAWSMQSVSAQDCACAGNTGGVAVDGCADCASCQGRGHGLFHHHHAARCGRKYTYAEASALWDGYCTDDCSYQGGGGHVGCARRGAGTLGRFGWPQNCACGNADCTGCDQGGGHVGVKDFFAGLHARHAGMGLGGLGFGHGHFGRCQTVEDCGCETDPCGGGRHFGHHQGCGLFSRLRHGGCGCSQNYFDECNQGVPVESTTHSVVEGAEPTAAEGAQDAQQIPLP